MRAMGVEMEKRRQIVIGGLLVEAGKMKRGKVDIVLILTSWARQKNPTTLPVERYSVYHESRGCTGPEY